MRTDTRPPSGSLRFCAGRVHVFGSLKHYKLLRLRQTSQNTKVLEKKNL